MTIRKFSDQGFDDFRKERKRMQAKLGGQTPAHAYENQALRELEQVEAREVRDQQLTREVHDFFAAATRQAAAIVDRVAKDAQQAAGVRVEQEMEAFLLESLTRMNNFIVNVLRERRGPVAETLMEPSVGNIVGPSLDEFRSAGTAEVGDKHIGLDPFGIEVEEVRREFREQIGQAQGDDSAAAVPMDEHLVAAVDSSGDAKDEADDAESDESESLSMPTVAPMTRTTSASMRPGAATAAAPAAAAAPAPTMGAAGCNDLERFKEALKALVRQGTMTRDEARAAWQTRMQSMHK